MYFTTHATRPTGLPEWMSQWSVSQSAPGLEAGGTAAQEPLWPPPVCCSCFPVPSPSFCTPPPTSCLHLLGSVATHSLGTEAGLSCEGSSESLGDSNGSKGLVLDSAASRRQLRTSLTDGWRGAGLPCLLECV